MSMSNKFSYYILEENDFFIKEYQVKIQFANPSNQKEMIRQEGNIILSSKSIIFESGVETNTSTTIIKFLFKFFEDKPKVVLIKGEDYLKIKVSRLIEIPSKYSQFLCHDIKTDVIIQFKFDMIDSILQLIHNTYQSFMSSSLSVIDSSNDDILNEISLFKFDYNSIKSISEKFLLKEGEFSRLVLPLIDIPGLVMLTDERIYFQNIYSKECCLGRSFDICYDWISEIYKRNVKLQDCGIEIIYKSIVDVDDEKGRSGCLLLFTSPEKRNEVYTLIIDCISSTVKKSLKTNINTNDLFEYTKLWSLGNISNYEYLSILNSSANRTKLDLSQYPVFPWVISDYKSSILRLNDDKTYRDLSLPIGAINPNRLKKYKERYENMAEPKFLYGTHYSTPAYVIGYLYRKHPEWMLKLNNGKYEHPNRQFTSIEGDWKINISDSGSLKELIPEFYEEDSSFLINSYKLSLGKQESGEEINNVVLPFWASNAYEFLRKNRLALESEYVSENLHHWIDLIFGYKQQGQSAFESNNLFHPISYQGNIDLSKVTTNKERKVLEMQTCEFGITPLQLFKKEHMKRFNNKIPRLVSKIEESIEKEDRLEIVQLQMSDGYDKYEKYNERGVDYGKPMNEKMENIGKITEKGNKCSKIDSIDQNIYRTRQVRLGFPIEFQKINSHIESDTILCYDIYENLLCIGYSNGFICIYSLNTISSLSNISKSIQNMHPIRLISKTRQQSLQSTPCSIHFINKDLILIGDKTGSTSIFNIKLNKFVSAVTCFYSKVKSIFTYDTYYINISNEGIIKKYSFNSGSSYKIPVNTNYYLDSYTITENYISSIDFNINSLLMLVQDSNEKLSILDIHNQKTVFSNSLQGQSVLYSKFNPVKDNEVYICSEEYFKVYDLRRFDMNSPIYEIDYFYNSVNIYNTLDKYLLFDRFSAQIYDNSYNIVKSYVFDESISSSFHSKNLSFRYSAAMQSSTEFLFVICSKGGVYLSWESSADM